MKAKDPLWAKEIIKKGNSQEVERTKPMAIMIIKIILQKDRPFNWINNIDGYMYH